jgi:hypothetical protein
MKAIELGPDWLAEEMPPGYNTRLLEIQRLSEELRAMGRFGQLLWTIGDELVEAVRQAFVAMRFESMPIPGAVGLLAVTLDGNRRLLVNVSSAQQTIQKKSPELAQVFHLQQELVGDSDRIVLVTNSHVGTRPAERPAPVEPDALKLLQRIGANVLPAPALFRLWTLSLQDRDRARGWVDRLHAQDGGSFELPNLPVV